MTQPDHSPPPARRTTVLVAALGVVALALGALTIALVLATSRANTVQPLSALERDGVAAARTDTLKFITLTPANAAAQVERLQAISTGAFRGEVDDLASRLSGTLTGQQVTATGEVDESAVTGSDAKQGTVSVLVAATQTVRNKATPEGEPRSYRIALLMQRIDTAWYVADLRFLT